MNSILERIIVNKYSEVNNRRKEVPLSLLKERYARKTSRASFARALTAEGATGIIAEFKPASPSEGVINTKAGVEEVTEGYIRCGASALSVLTDSEYFGSSFDNFRRARMRNSAPILQKDFFIDEYQIYEAGIMGADAILLIASVLNSVRVGSMAALAKELGMETILEIHEENELDRLCNDIDIVGINNRDLKSFSVDLQRSVEIAALIPGKYIKISESGIKTPADVMMLSEAGFNGFLMGTLFMKSDDPVNRCDEFIYQLNDLKSGVC